MDSKRALELAKQAYDASSAYIDTNLRADWSYSLRAFRNEHAEGSKYLAQEYQGRSKLFRPKTRSVIRKNEAAGAVALFSNMEVLNLTPENPDDLMNVAASEALKEVLEYRLSRTIPAFPLVMGALQDAQVQGMVCSYQYWEYEKKGGRVIKDKPCIDLRPVENIRIDGGASWLDPVGTSPYFCDIIPMYACQVKGMMETTDKKTGAQKWKKFDDKIIAKARPTTLDSLRQSRLGKQQDPHQEQTGIEDFDVVWVLRWFLKDSQNDDYTFYTLGTEEILTDCKPIDEVYFHGVRPYVMGYYVLETHKTFKTSMPSLMRPLQQEMNSIANQRIDNVSFVLNKRWLVARGRQVDVNSLVRGVPGGVTMTTDPKTDVVESNWADVTSSAYVEQDRLNADFDDLAGNFSPATKFANKGTNDTLGGTRMAAQGAGLMTDYGIRTFIESWYEPVLRQLVLLEQYYETDEVVLGVCAKKARLFPRFGVSQITDDLLLKGVNVNVNVGMGSSNPQERFQKLMIGTQAVMGVIQTAPPNFNVQEFIKEAYSNMGYRDGERFWGGQIDPRLAKATQIIQQLTAQAKSNQQELQAKGQLEQQKLLSDERVKAAELQVDQQRIQGDLRIRAAEIALEHQRVETEKIKLQLEAAKLSLEMKGQELEQNNADKEAQTRIAEMVLKVQGEEAKTMKVLADLDKARMDIEKAKVDLAKSKAELVNESKAGAAADRVNEQVKSMKEETKRVKEDLDRLNQGLGAMLNMTMQNSQPKRKLKGLTLKKGGSKSTNAVVAEYDDGSQEELRVARS